MTMIQGQNNAPPAESGENKTPPSDSNNSNTPPADDKSGGDTKGAMDDRPGWLPEKFKTPEDLAKSYTELESWRGKKDEELSAALLKDRPENAGKYELPKFDGGHVDHDALAKHPLVEWWRDQAYKRGLSNDEFQNGITKYVDALASNLPKMEDEIAKLGENANARIERVSNWANATFKDKDEFTAIQALGSTANGIKVLERIMKSSGASTDMNTGDNSAPTEDTEADIKKLMDSKAYWHPADRDPKVVERVEKFFSKKYK